MADTVRSNNQVEMFIDAVTTFETQLKGFSLVMDLTELIEYGEESITIIMRATGKIVRVVGKAMDLDVDGNGEAVQIWSYCMLALSRIAIVLAYCKIQEVTITAKVPILDRIVDDMLRLISMISRFTIGVTPAQLTTMTHIRAQITRLRTVLKKGGRYRFELVMGRFNDVFGFKGEHDTTTASVNHLTSPKPPLTMANVSRLPSSDNYRVLQPSMDYNYDYDQGQTSHWQETTSLDSGEPYCHDYKDNSSEDITILSSDGSDGLGRRGSTSTVMTIGIDLRGFEVD